MPHFLEASILSSYYTKPLKQAHKRRSPPAANMTHEEPQLKLPWGSGIMLPLSCGSSSQKKNKNPRSSYLDVYCGIK